MSDYYLEAYHVTDEEFACRAAEMLSKVEIKGTAICIHNEDGELGFLVPAWMMRAFLRDRLGLPETPPPKI